MKTTIWKFRLPIQDEALIEMPRGSVPLSVGAQLGELCLWARVPLDSGDNVIRRYRIYGTGNPGPSKAIEEYLGTVQIPPFVWHVFDLGLVNQ